MNSNHKTKTVLQDLQKPKTHIHTLHSAPSHIAYYNLASWRRENTRTRAHAHTGESCQRVLAHAHPIIARPLRTAPLCTVAASRRAATTKQVSEHHV